MVNVLTMVATRIYAYAAGRVWEGNTPTLKTLQKVAEGRMSSPSELTLEHRKLDKYFTEEQQMHLMYMKVYLSC